MIAAFKFTRFNNYKHDLYPCLDYFEEHSQLDQICAANKAISQIYSG